jgi:hypothetical protein
MAQQEKQIPSASSGQALRLRMAQDARHTPLRMTTFNNVLARYPLYVHTA